MCIARCILALMALHVGVVHSWDIAISVKEQLIFYTNGTKTDTVNLISQNPSALVYDEVHNMMLYVDKQSNNDTVCGYYLSSEYKKCFIKRNGRNIRGLAFDPVTEKIFFTDTNERSINFISLKPGSNNNIYGNLLLKMDDLDQIPADIAIDSCKGNIYWTTISKASKRVWRLERAQFNISKRRVMFQSGNFGQFSLVIDPQTQTVFYIDVCMTCGGREGFIHSNNFDGTDDTYLFKIIEELSSKPKLLTVSKDYIYWMNSSESYGTVLQFPKSAENSSLDPKEIIKLFNETVLGITANYKMHDQYNGMKDCDSLSSLMTANTVVFENHCMHGNCSLNDERFPKRSSNAGYTGVRCEVSACHGYCLNDGICSLNEISEPVCQCKGDYIGDRCEITDCVNYCMQGNCSYDEGYPTCSCNAGYSGERCEVTACLGYCSLNGDCSLNENSEPVCQCKGDYAGDRCEITDCLNYCMQGNCSFNDEGHPKCSCNGGYSGERCEVSACHSYCLNNGDCSLNEEYEPVCQCDSNYEGSRCEVDKNSTFTCTNTSTYYSVQKNLTLADLLSNWRKPTAKISVTVEV